MTAISLDDFFRRIANLLDESWTVTIRTGFVTRCLTNVRIEVNPNKPMRLQVHTGRAETVYLNLRDFEISHRAQVAANVAVEQFMFTARSDPGNKVTLHHGESFIDVEA